MRAHVPEPELSADTIETPAPRIAKAPRENLRAIRGPGAVHRAQGIRGKWIVRGNAIAAGAGAAADIDAQHLAEQIVGQLAIARDTGGAVVVTAVTGADVEVPIGSEQQMATIVVPARLVHLEQNLLGRRVE